jgi:hypothetical protein
MSKVIVHVGLEKTGTKSLQQFLRMNAALLQESGIVYSRLPDTVNHSSLAAALLNVVDEPTDLHQWHDVTPANQDDFRASVREQLGREVAGGGTVLLSGEHLSSRLVTSAHMDTLVALLGELEADVEIVMYLRRPVPFVESSWSMMCKSATTEPFDVEAHLRMPGRYDTTAIVERWAARFPGAVRAAAYREDWRDAPAALFAHFCAVVGVPWTDRFALPAAAVNPALGASDLELLVLLNRMRVDSPDPDVELFRHDFILDAERRGTGQPFRLTRPEAAAVEAAFGGDRIRLDGMLPDDDLRYLRTAADRPDEARSTPDDDRVRSLGTLLEAVTAATRAHRPAETSTVADPPRRRPAWRRRSGADSPDA